MRLTFTILLASGLLIVVGCRRPTPNEPVAADPGAVVAKPGEKAKQPGDENKELERLKGTWTVKAITAAGQPVPADRVQKMQLQFIFAGNKLITHRPDRADKMETFTVDTSVTPNRLTIGSNPVSKAVYALDGDKLRFCVMVDDNPNAGHPGELVSKAAPKTDLLILERFAAGPQVPGPGVQVPAPVPAGGSVYVYSQSTGKLTLNDQLVCVAYSGKGTAKNDPAKQAAKDGPIPIGEYLISPIRNDPKIGGNIIGLLPVAGGNFFNRFPGETFAIIAETKNPPSGCFIVVGPDVMDKLSTVNTKLRVVK